MDIIFKETYKAAMEIKAYRATTIILYPRNAKKQPVLAANIIKSYSSFKFT